MRLLLKYKKRIFIVTIILTLTVFAFYYIYKNSVNHDALMIKNSYESVNGEYKSMYIDSNADIKNISEKEAVEKIESSSGVIFIGYNKCEYCRETLSVILDVLSDNNMELMYLDGENLRDEYIVKNDSLKKNIYASASYYKLLDLLDDYIDPYIIEDDGKKYDTKEKRIELPTVIFISNGKVVGFYTSSKEEDYKELYKKFENDLVKIDGEVCSKDTKC